MAAERKTDRSTLDASSSVLYADFTAAALRNHRGDRIGGRFRVQPAIVGHQWRGLTGGGGWWGDSVGIPIWSTTGR